MIRQVSLLLPAIAVCLAAVQAYPEYSGSGSLNSQAPYSFGYATSESARQESSDASGKVTGSYRVQNEDGTVRVVNYVADDQGFRAEVETDEDGTTNDQPADVVVRSTAASPKMVERQMEQAKMTSAPLMLMRQQGMMYTPAAVRQERLQKKRMSSAAQRVVAQMNQQNHYGKAPVDAMILAPLMSRFQRAQQAQAMRYPTPAVQQERLQAMMYSRPAVQQERLQAMMKYQTPAVQQERLQAMMKYNNPAVQQERLQTMMKYKSPAVQQERLQDMMGMMYPTPAVPQEQFVSHYSSTQQGSLAHGFRYNVEHGDGGKHYRHEEGDGKGNVVGVYTVTSPNGEYRKVNYLADEGGFRAIVKTNEQGTSEESPAHAQFVQLV